MVRVTVHVDDELLARVMARYGLNTASEALEFALRQVLDKPKTTDEVLEMFGAYPDYEMPRDWGPRP